MIDVHPMCAHADGSVQCWIWSRSGSRATKTIEGSQTCEEGPGTGNAPSRTSTAARGGQSTNAGALRDRRA